MIYDWLWAGHIPNAIAYALSFTALLIGSITDLKTREVPDWVNYGLVMSGLILNLLFSIVYSQFTVNPIIFNNQIVNHYEITSQSYIISSIIGLSILFGVAYIMFYAGQWGGGDSKMLMGLGTMIGIDVSFQKPQFLSGFFINALFVGAVYGILWSVYLAFRNRKKFFAQFRKALSENSIVKLKKSVLAALILLIALSFFTKQYYLKMSILSLAPILIATFYLWVFVRAIEKSSMFRLVEPSMLTEGDWVVKDVYAGKEYICGPKDLGIEKSQVKRLVELYKNGKVKKILIKEGIPFVPSFFIAFIVTFVFGNPLTVLLF